MPRAHGAALIVLTLLLAACGDRAKLPLEAGIGPSPALPPPVHRLIPTVKVAMASSWPAGATPRAAPGLRVAAFATGLDHPRWLAVLPNGDVLVAETNAPVRPKDNPGLKGWFFKMFQKKAGGGVPSANRITLLRDGDGDGVAETRSVFLSGLTSPFGMQLAGTILYVADTDAVLAFPYRAGETAVTAPGRKLLDLPAGPINHHWTKNVIVSSDGARMFVAIGSNSNVGDNGIPAEEGRAQVWLVEPRTGSHRPFATGLRNPVGMAFEPETGALWVAVNERDEIGSDLVPDYMTSVRDGGFYGWPFSYYGQHVEARIKPADRRPDLVARALAPDYALGAHTASLGLAFGPAPMLGAGFAGGAFVGQHGSWNREPRSGYRVIFVPFANGRPAGPPVEILTGFLTADGKAMGRPVGVAIDKAGALLVADDVGNTIWRVTAAR
jgi:glucose/arabinose dehydrogenase